LGLSPNFVFNIVTYLMLRWRARQEDYGAGIWTHELPVWHSPAASHPRLILTNTDFLGFPTYRLCSYYLLPASGLNYYEFLLLTWSPNDMLLSRYPERPKTQCPSTEVLVM